MEKVDEEYSVENNQTIFIRKSIQSLSRIIGGAVINSRCDRTTDNSWNIVIRGKNITVTDTNEFVRLMRLTKNVDVNSRTDGTVEILFTYDSERNIDE